MRVLRARYDHVSCQSAGEEFQTFFTGYCPGYAGQRLPLWHLPARCESHSGSRQNLKATDMKQRQPIDIIAPEQYELNEVPVYQFNMNRRRFFQAMGSGLAIAFTTYKSMGGVLSEELKAPEDQVGAW